MDSTPVNRLHLNLRAVSFYPGGTDGAAGAVVTKVLAPALPCEKPRSQPGRFQPPSLPVRAASGVGPSVRVHLPGALPQVSSPKRTALHSHVSPSGRATLPSLPARAVGRVNSSASLLLPSLIQQVNQPKRVPLYPMLAHLKEASNRDKKSAEPPVQYRSLPPRPPARESSDVGEQVSQSKRDWLPERPGWMPTTGGGAVPRCPRGQETVQFAPAPERMIYPSY